MRVALFTEVYLPAVNGVVTHVKTLKEGLELLGHKAVIVTADSNVKKTRVEGDIIYCPAIRLEKLYGYDVAAPISPDRLKVIKDFDPDIIHIHNEFGIGISGAMMARQLKIPLVYTMHTMYDDYMYYVANNEHLRELLIGVTHKYAKVLARSASAITGPSKKVEEYFKRCGVNKHVTVIPNSVEVETFNRDAVDRQKMLEVRERYGFSADDLVFCFCGRMGQEKNIETLLDFWAKNVKPQDGMKLLLIGGGPQLEEFSAYADKLGVNNTVKFTDRIEHSDVPPYYAACDCYVTASLSECHSIAMMEGMATGMPVLTIRDELNADQIEEGVNGFYFRNADEMYDHMKKLREMPRQELEKLQRQSRETIIASGAQTIADHLLVVYEQAIQNFRNRQMLRRMPQSVKKVYKAQNPEFYSLYKPSGYLQRQAARAKRVAELRRQRERAARLIRRYHRRNANRR